MRRNTKCVRKKKYIGQRNIYKAVFSIYSYAENIIIDKKIEYPIQYEVRTAANSIAKELFRYETLKRSVKKMNYFSNKLRYLLHKRWKGSIFARSFKGAKVQHF